MKLPYGISNFRSLREEQYLYIDKSMYIEQLEGLNSKYLFFIRPRRFGKSLFLSMLEHYYDMNEKDNFPTLFGDLYIGGQPTARRNSYMVLKLNFSGLNTSGRTELASAFRARLVLNVESFFHQYAAFLEDVPSLVKQVRDAADASAALHLCIEAVRISGYKVYIFNDPGKMYCGEAATITLYEISYKSQRSPAKFIRFVRSFTQTSAVTHRILYFCTIFHTNYANRQLKVRQLYVFSYKLRESAAKGPTIVRFFIQTA